jgi:hypothetical protein
VAPFADRCRGHEDSIGEPQFFDTTAAQAETAVQPAMANDLGLEAVVLVSVHRQPDVEDGEDLPIALAPKVADALVDRFFDVVAQQGLLRNPKMAADREFPWP